MPKSTHRIIGIDPFLKLVALIFILYLGVKKIHLALHNGKILQAK